MTHARMVATLAVVAVLAVGCGSARGGATADGGGTNGGATDAGQLSGSIQVDGSSTVYPVTELAAERFNEEHPDVDVSVGFSGTGGGFEKFCRGETQISDASRPIRTEEAQACADAGIDVVELRIGLDGLSNIVHPSNDAVDCLTMDELAAVWRSGSDVTAWSDIREGLPDEPLTLFGPGPDSGTYDFFVEEVLGEDAQPRTDYTASEDDNVIVQGVEGNPWSLGYLGYAYYVENQQRLKVLAVDGGDGCVEPTPDAIESGDYPLSRPLFIYVSKDALEDEAVRAFVSFYLDNVESLVTDAGYVPPSSESIAESRSAFEDALP